jgi:hypothetical protein
MSLKKKKRRKDKGLRGIVIQLWLKEFSVVFLYWAESH